MDYSTPVGRNGKMGKLSQSNWLRPHTKAKESLRKSDLICSRVAI